VGSVQADDPGFRWTLENVLVLNVLGKGVHFRIHICFRKQRHFKLNMMCLSVSGGYFGVPQGGGRFRSHGEYFYELQWGAIERF